MARDKKCRFFKECIVYKGEVSENKTPHHIIKNVFCLRGQDGWNNCARYHLYIKSEEVPDHLMPHEDNQN